MSKHGDPRIQLPYAPPMIDPVHGETHTLRVDYIQLGRTTITEADLAKFHKLVGFMEFALGASEELRSLMVAYEAKQRILK